jgi:hypothetical protein
MSEISTPAPGAPTSSAAAWPFPRRFLAVFTSPRALFEHLAERPTWLAPLLVFLGVFALVFVILMDPVIVPEQIARIEESGRPNGDQAIAMMSGPFKWSFLVVGMFFITVATFVYAVWVFIVGSFVLGGKFTYRQALSLVSHASLVLVPSALLGIPLALVTKKAEVSFGPGAFFPVDQAEGLGGRFLSYTMFGFDIFRLWQTALIALGVAVMARISPPSRAAVPVWILFLLVTILGALMQAFAAGMGGG